MSAEEDVMCDNPDMPSDMSDDNQMYSAEYKDGQLHIVEVSPYEKVGEHEVSYEPDSILPDLPNSDDGEQTKYLQLDLLNFTIVKNADGTNTYQMMSSDSSTADDTTITCVLSSDDIDEGDTRDSYVMIQTDSNNDYNMLLSEQQSNAKQKETVNDQPVTQPTPSISKDKVVPLTPVQILEKAKALQKTNVSLAASASVTKNKRGRKRKSDLPSPMVLLSSPNFKLYLYSCKQCTFKCNAIKEMSAHKKSEHFNASKGAGAARAALQCARCPLRARSHAELLSHVNFNHPKEKSTGQNEYITALQLDSAEVEAADVLVCGACGFESGDRPIFKRHIEQVHGAKTS